MARLHLSRTSGIPTLFMSTPVTVMTSAVRCFKRSSGMPFTTSTIRSLICRTGTSVNLLTDVIGNSFLRDRLVHFPNFFRICGNDFLAAAIGNSFLAEKGWITSPISFQICGPGTSTICSPMQSEVFPSRIGCITSPNSFRICGTVNCLLRCTVLRRTLCEKLRDFRLLSHLWDERHDIGTVLSLVVQSCTGTFAVCSTMCPVTRS